MARPKRKDSAPTSPAPKVRAPDPLIRDLADMFRLLADRTRLKIVLALMQARRLNVSALKVLVKQSQPAVSHHLTLMRSAKLVDFERDGKNNYYFLASDKLRDLLARFFATAEGASLTLDDFQLVFQQKKPG